MTTTAGFLRSPRLRAVVVSIAIVFAPLGLARALAPWLGAVDHLAELTLLALPAAIVLGAWLGWRVVRPLQKLEAQVRTKTDLRGDLSLDREDEYAELTAAMNALLARLDARQRAHEAFVADTVHALKSPIAAVRLAAEQLGGDPPRGLDPLGPRSCDLDPPPALDEARRRRLARALATSAERLEQVTALLLDLSRAEAGLPGETRVRADLVAIVREALDRARSDGRWPAIELALEAAGPVAAELVAPRIAAAVDALLDNARSFAQRRVVVEVREAAGRAVLSVHDDGSGVPDADRERIFARFVTTRPDGTGIGLALVRAVAEAHGGSARAEPGATGGARLTLEVAQRQAR